jgi:D-alanyl-D-alanine carboxypeptidase/D-alanyl-D-alanine-endopeptidase (penicillin-binding protein 4)
MPQAAQTINSIVNSPTFAGGRWGIRVEPLNDNTLLYEHGSGNYYIPASNNKLFISAAALQLYDPRSPISSSTLGSWIQTILRNSNNGYADSLFRRLGGSTVVHRTLAQLGIDPNGYRMADGSGLSRQNATKPVILVDLLQVMDDSAGADVFRAALPIAGSTGTLSRRFRGTPAQGRVLAKTGTLRGVRALSGYANNPYYGPLAFSILVNQPGQSGDRMLAAIDRIVLLLMQAQPCGADSLQVDPVTRPQPAPGRGLESLQEEIERLREEFRRSRQP